MATPEFTDEKSVLGDKLKQAREEVGLTQAQVAEHLDVSEMTVYRWETGRFEPSFAKLQALSRLFQSPLETLLGGMPAANAPKSAPTVAYAEFRGYLPADGSSDASGLPDVPSTVPIPEFMAVAHPNLLAAQVVGDSLAAQGMNSGDMLFLAPDAPLRPGNLYVTKSEEGKLDLRSVSFEEGRILLRSGFDRYEELPISGVEFLGMVVWHLRRLG